MDFTNYINKLGDYFKTTKEKSPSLQSSFETVLETNIMESDSDNDEKTYDKEQYDFVQEEKPDDILNSISNQLYSEDTSNYKTEEGDEVSVEDSEEVSGEDSEEESKKGESPIKIKTPTNNYSSKFSQVIREHLDDPYRISVSLFCIKYTEDSTQKPYTLFLLENVKNMFYFPSHTIDPTIYNDQYTPEQQNDNVDSDDDSSMSSYGEDLPEKHVEIVNEAQENILKMVGEQEITNDVRLKFVQESYKGYMMNKESNSLLIILDGSLLYPFLQHMMKGNKQYAWATINDIQNGNPIYKIPIDSSIQSKYFTRTNEDHIHLHSLRDISPDADNEPIALYPCTIELQSQKENSQKKISNEKMTENNSSTESDTNKPIPETTDTSKISNEKEQTGGGFIDNISNFVKTNITPVLSNTNQTMSNTNSSLLPTVTAEVKQEIKIVSSEPTLSTHPLHGKKYYFTNLCIGSDRTRCLCFVHDSKDVSHKTLSTGEDEPVNDLDTMYDTSDSDLESFASESDTSEENNEIDSELDSQNGDSLKNTNN